MSPSPWLKPAVFLENRKASMRQFHEMLCEKRHQSSCAIDSFMTSHSYYDNSVRTSILLKHLFTRRCIPRSVNCCLKVNR